MACVDLVLGAILAFGTGTGVSQRTIPSFSKTWTDPAQQLDRDVFRSLLDRYFKAKQISVDWDMVDNLEDHFLIANLGMMCPFNAQEKQALLEARDYVHMTEIMMSLMEMAIQESAITANDNSQVRH